MPVEQQYNNTFEFLSDKPDKYSLMGPGIAWAFNSDPKHVLFTLSRYKFCSKILHGREHTIEIGCGDGWASRLLLQEVKRLTAIDVDRRYIDAARALQVDEWCIDFQVFDFETDGPWPGKIFDSAVCLDVIEHISYAHQEKFLDNIVKSLKRNSLVIIGSPSLESQQYASPQSKKGHIGCLTQGQLLSLCGKHMNNPIIFSMNDEVIHTGYAGMSHYNICIGSVNA